MKTDAAVGSGLVTHVQFRTSEDSQSGIRIDFTDPPTYTILKCTLATEFYLSYDEDNIRIWTIEVYSESVSLSYDGIEVINFNYSTSTLADTKCATKWATKTTDIRFLTHDDATQSYRNLPMNAMEVDDTLVGGK